MRFVQFADCHLDSTIGGATGLPEKKRSMLRQDIRRATEQACALALERKADLVLVPGDLFDYECLRPETLGFLVDLFRNLAPIRVFVAPGNHDPLRPGSPYLPGPDWCWPDNVHIFTSRQFESIEIPELGCTVTGVGHIHNGITDRLLASPATKTTSSINILLFHGSRDGYRPSEKESVLPFSDHELILQEFDYAAIGHYHSFGRIENGEGHLLGAYSGCVQGRGLDETGPKHALAGEIKPGARVTVETVEVCERRIVALEVPLTGATTGESAMTRVENALTESKARECDIVHIRLCGSLAPGVSLDTRPLEDSARYFHVAIDRSRLGLDYDIDLLAQESSAPTLRSSFVRRMTELIETAQDEQSAGVLRDAIYYGLQALDGTPLEPRDAD